MGKVFGKGTQLRVEDSPASGTFTALGEIQTISGPSFEAEEVDVTAHDSPGSFREFVRGLIDAGEVQAEMNLDPSDTQVQQLFADLGDGTARNYQIRWAQMTPVQRLDFTAFVRTYPFSSPVDNVLKATLTLRVTGQPVLVSE